MKQCIEMLRIILSINKNNDTQLTNNCVYCILSGCQKSGNFVIGTEIISTYIDYRKISNKTLNAIIGFYGAFNEIHSAESVFESIPKQNVNTININALMTCYLRNNKTNKCMALYQENHELLDNISHLLALKACIKSRNHELGRRIITQCVEPCSIELLTTMIDFYGQCKDTTSCINIFRSIPHRNRTVVTIGAMMKSYIKNHCNQKAISLSNGVNAMTPRICLQSKHV
eukprot:643579_1